VSSAVLQRILIIQTAFTGDVVLATPVAEKLHRHYPGAEIDMLVRKGNEGLLAGHPFLHQVLVWNKQEGKLRNLWNLLRQIRKRRYDLVINLHRFTSSGILAGFSGAKQRIGFDKNPMSWRYTRALPHEIGTGRHEIRRNLDLIVHLTDDEPQAPRLYPSEADEKAVSFHKQAGAYICIAPASVWFTKQWPASQWLKLIALVPAQYRIYLLGAPGDNELCEKIRRDSGRAQVMNMAGQLSFLQSVSMVRDAAMNYVNDSAPLHFASASDAKVTAVFCSTVPAFGFGPVSPQSRVVEVAEKLSCRPCGLHGHASCPEAHFNCALKIDPAVVLGELQ
jgi:heptosyltransferase II